MKKSREQARAEPVVERRKPARRRQTFLPIAIGMSGGVALAGVAFWFFKKQADFVVEGKADHYDGMIMDLVHSKESRLMNQTMEQVTALGSHLAIGMAAGLTALAMARKSHRHDAWTVIISTGGAMALNTLLKSVFKRQRPQERARQIKLPHSHSFPSGHSLLSAAAYPIVAHHLVQNSSAPVQIFGHALAGITIVSVGFSRIYLGVHFPSDVLGGFAAGLGWLGLTSLSHTMLDRDLSIKRPRK